MRWEQKIDEAKYEVRKFLKSLVYEAEDGYESGSDFIELAVDMVSGYQDDLYDEPLYSNLCDFFGVVEDEPTGELDDEVAEFVAEALKEIHKNDEDDDYGMDESRQRRGRMLREEENSFVAWEDPRTLEDFIEELEDLRHHSKNLTQKQYTLMIELTDFLKKLSKKMKG